jgi:hypothetical protein
VPTTTSTGHGHDSFDAEREERDEDDVHPLAGEHERPERNLRRARFDRRREPEVAGDHGRTERVSRGLGQGSRESSTPMTTTKRMSPMMNDMAVSPRVIFEHDLAFDAARSE